MLIEASGQEQATQGLAVEVPLPGGALGDESGMELPATDAAGSQGELVGAVGASGGVWPLALVQPHLLQSILAGLAAPASGVEGTSGPTLGAGTERHGGGQRVRSHGLGGDGPCWPAGRRRRSRPGSSCDVVNRFGCADGFGGQVVLI